jgi:hypothetical protein
MASPPNPVAVPIVTYEYLFYLLLSEWPGHLLNRRLRVYCRGLVPSVPWTAGYNLKHLDTARFPPAANDWGTKCPVLDMAPCNTPAPLGQVVITPGTPRIID